MSLAQTILDGVVSGYLYRRSWHGTSLEARDAEELTAVKEAVSALIWAGSIQVRSEDEDPNPAIMRLWAAPLEKQFAWVEASEDNGVYLFPTRAVLVDRPEIAELREEPYTQRLALGEPQLAPAFFELGVLDRYRRDPRYQYKFEDYTGFICIRDDPGADLHTPERDKILIQSFGIAYRPDGSRAVAVGMYYLSQLSPEHQRQWQAREIDEECKLARAFLDGMVGIWRTEEEQSGSVFRACLEEQAIINDVCDTMGRPHLFRETYERDRPREFSPFTEPTVANYNAFAQLLDKMLSQNIDGAFFQNEVDRRDANGNVRGTLKLLGAWLSRPNIRWSDGAVDQIMKPLFEVRATRNPDAHAIQDDEYDLNLYDRQNRLMGDLYQSLRAIRNLLLTDPRAKPVHVPDWIERWRIQPY